VGDSVPSSCSTSAQSVSIPFSNLLNQTVILLQPGVSTQVCVVYQANWLTGANNYTVFKDNFFSNGILNFTAQVYNLVRVPNSTAMTYTTSHSFKISAEPASIRPTPNLTKIAITYTITPLSNATGYYDRFLFPGIMLSVGHSGAQVGASDFPYANTLESTGMAQPYVPVSVYVTGAEVTQVTYSEVTFP
jgi:hypothetical protein